MRRFVEAQPPDFQQTCGTRIFEKSVSFCKVNDAVAITLFRVLNEGWKHFKLPELPELRVAPGILPGGIFQDTSFHIISSRHQVAFHTLSS